MKTINNNIFKEETINNNIFKKEQLTSSIIRKYPKYRDESRTVYR
jgi:hypothetical protein